MALLLISFHEAVQGSDQASVGLQDVNLNFRDISNVECRESLRSVMLILRSAESSM
jgi:hypothetical protein